VSDTALNLLAIAIFTITMASLSAPLTGLSPLIPTGITVLLLALYGLDSGYGEGRGGALVLEWLEARLPGHKERQERIVYHEAGHFLAAYLLDIKVLGYNLQSKAGVEVDASYSEVPLNLLERYCTVWMAGIAAEQHIYQTAMGGIDDIQKLKIATKHLPNSQLQQRWALLRAQNLVSEHQTAFQALVTAMKQNASVEACCEILISSLDLSGDS